MRTIRTIAELRAHLARARAQGRTVGLVPTMGAFHAGHHSLISAARAAHDELVVSLFVNPAQFNESADLAAYPRDEAKDAAQAQALGVDVLFVPPVEEIYPAGFATTVHVEGLTDVLEGMHRGAAHFDGVCTVVAKLLNIVGPDAAYFGQKDAQQVAVVKRLVRDLDIPARIEVLPTIRDADGVALSSRNQLLSAPERQRARALSRGLRNAAALVADGERDADALTEAARAELVGAAVTAEYVALVDPDSFEPLTRLDGPAVLAVAARVGAVRLIDNVPLEPVGAPVATG
jgi:pantoate--beta-alanine ligase